MVLYRYSDRRAAVWCEERGWEYHDATDIFGCEAQCVVLLDCWLESEYLTRARNMLIILNNDGRVTKELQAAVDHERHQLKDRKGREICRPTRGCGGRRKVCWDGDRGPAGL